jgi:hypothetical protein
MQKGVASWRSSGARISLTYFLGALADGHRAAGRIDDGLAVVDEAIRLGHDTRDRWCEALHYRLRADLWLDSFALEPTAGKLAAAEASLGRAFQTARDQGATLFELSAGLGLVRLGSQQGDLSRARALLAATCASFQEGADTPEFRQARAFLAGHEAG